MSSTQPAPDDSRRYPALDGLRGIAILMVLVHHGMALSRSAPNRGIDHAVELGTTLGWAGVDLFFVLSGFLITGILLDYRGRFANLVSFYGRRGLRIIPVFAALLIALLVVLPLLVPSMRDNADLDILRDNKWWYATFTFNIMVALEPLEPLGRFGNGHLWSLMVEEQFYLIWPFIILLAPRRLVLPVLAAVIIAAPLFRFALVSGAWPDLDNRFSAMILMPARMDTLAWGGVAAWCIRDATMWRRLRAVLPYAAMAAVAAIAAVIASQGDFDNFRRGTQVVGFSAIGVLFTSLLVASIAMPSSLGGVLSHPFLRFFGLYSYALYVFHFQIMVEVARGWDDMLILGSHTISRGIFTVITIWFSIVVAWLSWHLMERHALALKRYFPQRTRTTDGAPDPIVPATAGG